MIKGIVNNKITQVLIRLFIGCTFILSGIFKLMSIDEFEIYIFSHQFFGLNVSYVLARLLISAELIIGLFFIFNLFPRIIKYLAIIVLVAFTGYLMLYFNNSDNCYCFGDIVELDHFESILKNILLLVLLFLFFPKSTAKRKFWNIIVVLIILFSVSLPNIISPPDFLYVKLYKPKTDINHQHLFTSVLNNPDFPYNFTGNKTMLCMYGPKCSYCKKASEKLSVIFQRNEIGHKHIFCIFWGDENSVEPFFEKSNTPLLPYTMLPVKEFLDITEGKMPLILLLNDSKIEDQFGYREINETRIKEFFKEN